MKRKRRTKHSAAFKAKIALAVVSGESTVTELARKHKLHATQIYQWKRQFLENMEKVFESETAKNESGERENALLKKIGELTMERDFLSRGLERYR